MHTGFLALLYDVLPKKYTVDALANSLHPPEEMVKVGSPFAMLYLYEALEKAGQLEAILTSIYENYVPMLKAGATTVWEVFPSSSSRPENFPTRSHCHGWSSVPLHFLPRIVLGLRSLEPGSRTFEISPRPGSLSWAKGAVATPHGPVQVAWSLEGKRLHIEAHAPQGVTLGFVMNKDLARLQIEKNF
jgi:hypothetical protein